jgi:predicted porin
MKMHPTFAPIVLALGAGLSLSTAAQGQGTSSVTVYGLLDHYVEYLNHIPLNTANPAAGHTTQKNVGSGGWNTSRLGFRGVEQLGDGLAAEFNLEHGMAGDTGTAIGAMWARQAWVGMNSKTWGKLQLGRTTTTINDMVLGHDPMRNAPRFSWLPSTGSTSTYSYSTRLDNMLKYSHQFGSTQVMAHYSAGEQAGATKPGSGYGIGAKWDTKQFSLEGAYDQRHGTRNAAGLFSDTTAYSLSGQYKTPATVFTLGAISYDQIPATGAQRKSKLYWTSVEHKVTGPLTAVAGLYLEDLPSTSSDPTMLVLNATYAFSPRTSVYVTAAYAWARASGTTQTPVSVVRTSTANTPYYGNQTGTIVGLRHRF